MTIHLPRLLQLPALLAHLSGLARPVRPTAPPPDIRRISRWAAPCGTTLTLRPVQPQDAPLLGALVDQGLSPASRRLRFHAGLRRLSPAQQAWLADADFSSHVAYLVTCQVDGVEQAVAEGRWVRTGLVDGAEFALAVADDWQRQGIGRRLLQRLVDSASVQGVVALAGDVLPGNPAMQALAQGQLFDCRPHPSEAGLLRAARPLKAGRLAADWFH